MKPVAKPVSALFFSGIHMDMLGALKAPALIGSSNPGKFTAMPGGASLNTASVAGLLGLDCAIIGLVGDDTGGETLAQTLHQRTITNLLSIRKDHATGNYTSIIEPNGNLLIAVADLDLNEQMSAQWLLDNHTTPLEQADIWFLNANLTTDTLLTLSDRNLTQRPNLLAAASISPSKSRKLIPSLANLDVLFTNIVEANAMLGGTQDARTCIAKFQSKGISKGTLSQGADSLWVWDETAIAHYQPPTCDHIEDVTGAGDALAGTFLAGLARGISMQDIAPNAIAAAQMTVGVKGPYNENICWSQLNSRAANIKQHP